MSDATEMNYIVVVGLNRPRLAKIIGLVKELAKGSDLESTVEFVPCLAALKAYKDGDGNELRYLANFVCHDGSPMTKYLDDDDFRSSLMTVLAVGYEWKERDEEHVAKYFETSQLDVPVERVQPNSDFDNLEQEMDFFKSLNEEEKEQHLSDQKMGPGKMAGFIINSTKALLSNNIENNIDEEAKEANEATSLSPEEDTKLDETEESLQKKKLIINPNLPRYACRICRTMLFGQDHLAREHVQNLHSFKKANYDAKRPTVACQSIFCSEAVLEHLSEHGQDVEGKLACPKCDHKIGHWRWSGAQVRTIRQIKLVTLHFPHFCLHL